MYAGEMYDKESGFYYLRARYYDTKIGRFISEDTYKGQVDNPLSLNRYTYTHNNPIRYVDPSGNQVSESGGWEPGGSYFYYDHDGVRRIHGSKEIDWNYYREWFESDQAGMQDTLRGTNKVKNYIAAKVTWDWVMENGVPMDGGGVGKVPGVAKSKSTTFKPLFGCNCFTAGTKVLTDEGEKPIEEIEVGDKVLAKDDETGQIAYKKVEWLFQRDVEETYNITVGGEVITTTDEHPFWIVKKGWVESKNLVVGDVLTNADGKELTIEKIGVKKEHVTVYNFKVKDFHTYFVSNLHIWTHNQCGDKFWRFTYHYEKHVKGLHGGGREYGNITEQQYYDIAIGLKNSKIDGIDVFSKTLDRNKVQVMYRKSTNDIIYINPDGTIGSMFKPKKGIDFYERVK